MIKHPAYKPDLDIVVEFLIADWSLFVFAGLMKIPLMGGLSHWVVIKIFANMLWGGLLFLKDCIVSNLLGRKTSLSKLTLIEIPPFGFMSCLIFR